MTAQIRRRPEEPREGGNRPAQETDSSPSVAATQLAGPAGAASRDTAPPADDVPQSADVQAGTRPARARRLAAALNQPPRVWVVVLVPIAAVALVLLGGYLWPWQYRFYGQRGTGPDATTLIGTLVVVYTFFVAAYGALAPSLLGRLRWQSVRDSKRDALRAAAIWSMGVGVVLDLYRVILSTGDLYSTTMRRLPPPKVHDAAVEFGWYFAANVVILLFALLVTCLPESRAGSGDASADGA